MSPVFLLFWLAGASVCGLLGAVVGAPRERAGLGFFLGLLFGPLGVIATFALDGRQPCPMCRNRINTGATLCPACRSPLMWFEGTVGTPENIAVLRAQRDVEYRAAVAAFRRQERRRKARQLSFERSVERAILGAWKSITFPARVLSNAIARGFSAVHGGIVAVADGSRSAYIALCVGWFVLIPTAFLVAVFVIAGASTTKPFRPVEDFVAEEAAGKADAAPKQSRPRAVAAPPAPAARPAEAEAPAMAREAAEDVAPPVPEPAVAVEAAPMPRPVMADAGEVADVEPQPPRPVMAGVDEAAENRRERAGIRARIRTLEKEIQTLAKKRSDLQQKARMEIAQNAMLDAAEARTGRPFTNASPEPFLREAEKVLTEIRKLRVEVDELKKSEAAARRE